MTPAPWPRCWAGSTACPERSSRVALHLVQRAGNRVDVARVGEQRGVAQDFGHRASVRCHDRDTGLHRLERRVAEAFVDRRVGEHRGAREEVEPLVVVHVSHPADPVAVASGGDGGIEGLHSPRVGAGDHQHEGFVVTGDGVERLHEARQVLAWLDAPEREHVAVGAGALAASRRVAADRWHEPGVHPSDALGLDAEVVANFRADEVTEHMDRRATVERQPYVTREGECVGGAQLGVPHEREVVHRRDHRCPSRRRNVVRRVHDVDLAGPHLCLRVPGVTPQHASEPRRDVARARLHVARCLVPECPTTSQRDGEGGDVEVVALRKRLEQVAHHVADPGAGSEQ